jgi:hypothetical protein
MDVLLAPDQVILKSMSPSGIRWSSTASSAMRRNYAGTSFVTPEMFGTYRYGSDLLNITFDPTNPEQFVSYGFDDDGHQRVASTSSRTASCSVPSVGAPRKSAPMFQASPMRGLRVGIVPPSTAWPTSTLSRATPP